MGAWIEISQDIRKETKTKSRTPRWVRGLKSLKEPPTHTSFVSHPTMGAWIEIFYVVVMLPHAVLSHPTMGAWIEISHG